MDEAKSTGGYDAGRDDTFLIVSLDEHLKERLIKARAQGKHDVGFELGQALAYLSGLSKGRLGMTADELIP